MRTLIVQSGIIARADGMAKLNLKLWHDRDAAMFMVEARVATVDGLREPLMQRFKYGLNTQVAQYKAALSCYHTSVRRHTLTEFAQLMTG